jgi:hypothetical protein
MASIREYFDADFNHAVKVHVKLAALPFHVEVVVLYDFAAFTAFVACYVPGDQNPPELFLQLIGGVQPGKSQVTLDGKVTLPSARMFPGQLQIKNTNPFELHAKFFGDPDWASSNDTPTSSRLFIYTESRLTDVQILELKQRGRELGQSIQFRSIDHAVARSRYENPLAFISHDSRDKVEVAKKIAISLQKMMCPVWYDEFSLNVGANLRNSIEDGLKKCKKCILILSPYFFSNGGWTKKEFDSIFTREILEERQLVLPVWYGVTKQSVYDYCPSLLNVKGIDWHQLGEDEVCRQLCRAILDQER